MSESKLAVRFEDEERKRLVITKAVWDAIVTAPQPGATLELCASVRDVIARGGKFLVDGISETDDGVYLSVDGMHDFRRMTTAINETRAEKGVSPLPSED